MTVVYSLLILGIAILKLAYECGQVKQIRQSFPTKIIEKFIFSLDSKGNLRVALWFLTKTTLDKSYLNWPDKSMGQK